MTHRFEAELAKRQRLGNRRHLLLYDARIDFASNDYLGLSRSPDLAATLLQEWDRYPSMGLGSTGSRLLTGNSVYAEQLEETIANFHGYEAGLLFNCGYMANIGVLSAITGPDDCIIFDAHIHASTHDGIHLSRTRAFPFRHQDLEHLEHRLSRCSRKGAIWICVESIYSTDGSIAPLEEICQLASQYQAHLIVDEAHATGVWGPQGRGLIAEKGLTNHVFAHLITFGKALGTHGAIVLGTSILKEYLINFARSCIYTTALPFHLLAAIQSSYTLFPNLEQQRLELLQLIHQCQTLLPNASRTHIQSISIQGNTQVRQLAHQLMQEGFDVRPLMSPTVQQGYECLRICLHTFNTEHELTTLLECIAYYRSRLYV
jgi:8-amino-7-oxononanoate synthase